MAGERSTRMVDLAARAAARTSRRLQMITDYYAPDTAQSHERTILLKEWFEEYDKFGHAPPDPNCNSPICVKWRAFAQDVMMAMQQQGQPGGSP